MKCMLFSVIRGFTFKDVQSFMQIKFSSLPWYLQEVLEREKGQRKNNCHILVKLADKRSFILSEDVHQQPAFYQLQPGLK